MRKKNTLQKTIGLTLILLFVVYSVSIPVSANVQHQCFKENGRNNEEHIEQNRCDNQLTRSYNLWGIDFQSVCDEAEYASSSGTNNFYGESNGSIYIVTLESPSDIIIVDGRSIITGRSNGTQTSAGSGYVGCLLTDGNTIYEFGGAGDSEGVQIGKLRFLRLNLGKLINYTYDIRDYQTYEHNDIIFGLSWENAVLENITIPSGKWHLIFFGLEFDLECQYVLCNYKVWLNFSEECENLTITTSEGGRTYGLCYANYDANVIFSRSWTIEGMLNGKADFQINDTFLYEFIGHPLKWGSNGIWNVVWDTPQGKHSFLAVMVHKKLYYDEDKARGAV